MKRSSLIIDQSIEALCFSSLNILFNTFTLTPPPPATPALNDVFKTGPSQKHYLPYLQNYRANDLLYLTIIRRRQRKYC